MEINTTRFGAMVIEAADVIHFPQGLAGLTERHDWVLLADTQKEAVAWLQSVDRPDIALAVVSPRRFVPNYQMRVARRELEPLKLQEITAAQVLIILGKTDNSVTLNLKAPLVFNLERRLGRQVITNGELPLRYELGSALPSLKKSA